MPKSNTEAANALGRQIIQSLKDDGMIQEEIARIAGVNQSRISEVTAPGTRAGLSARPLLRLADHVGRKAEMQAALGDFDAASTSDDDMSLPLELREALAAGPLRPAGSAVAKIRASQGITLTVAGWNHLIDSVETLSDLQAFMPGSEPPPPSPQLLPPGPVPAAPASSAKLAGEDMRRRTTRRTKSHKSNPRRAKTRGQGGGGH